MILLLSCLSYRFILMPVSVIKRSASKNVTSTVSASSKETYRGSLKSILILIYLVVISVTFQRIYSFSGFSFIVEAIMETRNAESSFP